MEGGRNLVRFLRKKELVLLVPKKNGQTQRNFVHFAILFGDMDKKTQNIFSEILR